MAQSSSGQNMKLRPSGEAPAEGSPNFCCYYFYDYYHYYYYLYFLISINIIIIISLLFGSVAVHKDDVQTNFWPDLVIAEQKPKLPTAFLDKIVS